MNTMHRFTLRLLLCLALLPGLSQAGIMLSGTRLVFPGARNEATLNVTAGDEDVVFQSWLEANGDPQAEIPFSIVPGLAHVNARQSQVLRVMYQGTQLPRDRESLYWLNVQEIPKVSTSFTEGKSSGLAFTVRQRIKMFFRPADITTEPIGSTEKLIFQVGEQGKALHIENPTANHITLISMTETSRRDKTQELQGAVMIAPFSSERITLADAMPSQNAVVEFSSIDDFGYPKKFRIDFSAGAAPVLLED